MNKFFLKVLQKKPSGALFLSGNGSNAEKILEHVHAAGEKSPWIPKLLVTDRPKTSRAREIAQKYNIPLLEHPIASFYRAHGCEQVSLATEEGRRLRDLWTEELAEKLQQYEVDFGILAGFVPLTNIVAKLPCLNVHPGDLTYEKNGKRYLVGLHTVPMELAILEGHSTLRSSVILVQPYTPGAKEMDGGHILGISAPVGLDLKGHSVQELQELFNSRKGPHRHGLHHDLLSELANYNQERLKYAGDHTVYPALIDDFTAGCFAEDENKNLLYRQNAKAPFQIVKTVEYHGEERIPIYK